MPRSQITRNLIDMTFTIVVNILLGIILTTSGEKKAFIYYRDCVIRFLLFAASSFRIKTH
ncbi:TETRATRICOPEPTIDE REPEAT PROTEIN 5 [Salix koriyanagi]|uniref:TETRATRICOPEPTIDE REPEAT PROTEIN 5 n=1 Tax=Salix koriyanagi TaxID=2511006 RepID=A0A9Q0VQU4_9ROSI|nr:TETRATRICOPEPTIDE REPEAT PROTEIN 5 [Salix koriyanagi]